MIHIILLACKSWWANISHQSRTQPSEKKRIKLKNCIDEGTLSAHRSHFRTMFTNLCKSQINKNDDEPRAIPWKRFYIKNKQHTQLLFVVTKRAMNIIKMVSIRRGRIVGGWIGLRKCFAAEKWNMFCVSTKVWNSESQIRFVFNHLGDCWKLYMCSNLVDRLVSVGKHLSWIKTEEKLYRIIAEVSQQRTSLYVWFDGFWNV